MKVNSCSWKLVPSTLNSNHSGFQVCIFHLFESSFVFKPKAMHKVLEAYPKLTDGRQAKRRLIFGGISDYVREISVISLGDSRSERGTKRGSLSSILNMKP